MKDFSRVLAIASLVLTGACASANSQESAVTAKSGDDVRIVKKIRTPRHVVRVNRVVEDVMEDKDTDNDGRISKKEYYTGPNQGRFDDIDADGDDFISQAELDAYLKDRVENWAENFDGHRWVTTDWDDEMGELTIDMEKMGPEIEIIVKEAHEKAAEAMEHAWEAMKHAYEDMDDDEFVFAMPHLQGFGLDNEEVEKMRQKRRARLLTRLDKDGDGAVSREEFAQRQYDQFERLDENADGKLSDDELDQHFGLGVMTMPHFADRAYVWKFKSDKDERDDD